MRKGARTKEQIVERAVTLASRDGLEGLTIGSLATELGLSKSGLFAHFGSKEELQLQVLKTAVERFTEGVVMPALDAPRGEPRLRALFEGWLEWEDNLPSGCPLLAATFELDDQPGPQRDFLHASQKQWYDALAKAARLAVDERHFRGDLDPQQFAFEMTAAIYGYHHLKRLFQDPKAKRRARNAFERLIADSRA